MSEKREIVRTLELETPIDYAGEKLTTLVFYEPTTEFLDHLGSGAQEGTRALDLVAYLSELPREVVRSLDVLDALEATEIAGELMAELQKKVAIRRRKRKQKRNPGNRS